MRNDRRAIGVGARQIASMLAVASALALGACETASHTERVLSACAVLGNPAAYDGRVVSVRGTITSDFFEYSGMEDAQCPRKVISLGPENLVESGQPELRNTLQRFRGNDRVRVEATATGEIRYRPDEVPFLVILTRTYSDIAVIEQ